MNKLSDRPLPTGKLTKQALRQAERAVEEWFALGSRKPFVYQRKTWHSYLAGEDGLINAPTGTGKTLAAFLGAAIEELAARQLILKPRNLKSSESNSLNVEATAEKGEQTGRRKASKRKAAQLRVLWISPLRALATDTEANLIAACAGLGLDWIVEKRTGDSSSAVRARQRNTLPDVLVTTPESLTLLLSREDCLERFHDLRLIVVDEWHELLGNKRGVQTELALARVRHLRPQTRIWGLSATIGNLSEALETLLGTACAVKGKLIRSNLKKSLEITSLIPPNIERFPWAGHLGQRMADQVAQLVRSAKTSLVFTNTRSQSELWYRALLAQLPEFAGQMAVHHGSIDQQLRGWIENQLRSGKLRCCICTSSLDLGVDFPTVDHVIQIGSPKGNARLLQRAGRSGHQPGATSRITFVPTHALELVELAALRTAIAAGHLESKTPLNKPLDVLAQHVVTVALGGGFQSEELYAEVRTSAAYRDLTREEWQWVIDFAERGGSSLAAYPDYHRIKLVDGRYVVPDNRLGRLHRLSIGTIVSDAAIQVRYLKGRSIGSVEESFVSRMVPGDRFTLAGKVLELVNVHDNTAWVRRAKGAVTAIPRWMGGRMPLSSELSQALRDQLQEALHGRFHGVEMEAVRSLLDLQMLWSTLPAHGELLMERLTNRDGYHLFVYPFEGRLVHEGLAALFALRISRLQPISFSMAMNDYGFMLVAPTQAPLDAALHTGLLSSQRVAEDILSSLNATEMTRRQFREVARIAGLLFQGYPGQRKSSRHLQASSNLFHDVFKQYDSANMLLKQAEREVLEQQLEQRRMTTALERMDQSRLIINQIEQPTPLAFPLLVDQLRDRLSSESLADRVRRMQSKLEKSADHAIALKVNKKTGTVDGGLKSEKPAKKRDSTQLPSRGRGIEQDV